MCGLRFLEVNVTLGRATGHDFRVLSLLMSSLCMSPATLERLKFIFSFCVSVSREGNAIDRHTFLEDLRGADAWSHLDSIATHPSPAGSRLRRVEIDFNFYFCFGSEDPFDGGKPDGDEILKAILDGLPSLRTKDILFVKSRYGSTLLCELPQGL
jgi:hypothetical protein